MKKYFITTFAIVIGSFISVNAQTINDIPLKDIDVKYIEIVGRPIAFSTKESIQIDFGQENKFFIKSDTHIMDANGKVVNFNSMIDALNFMSNNGYDFIDSYVITNFSGTSSSSTTHYVLKKTKE